MSENKIVNIEETKESGCYVHIFKTPFEYEGKKFESLNFYFNNLTGTDIISIESEMQANNEFVPAPELSKSFQAKLAAKAASIGSDVIEHMSIIEFSKITNVARNFLLEA